MTSLIFGILKNDTNELIYKTKIDSWTQKANMVTKRKREEGREVFKYHYIMQYYNSF